MTQDRDLETWKAAVRRALPGDLALCRLYDCTVRAQRADGTLDVEPDDKATLGPALGGVPILHGLPGVRVRVAAGARVLVGFLGGWREVADGEAPDGPRPFAALWDTDAAMVEIVIGGGSKPLARVGDTVDIGTLTYVGPGSLTWVHPDPTHVPPTYSSPTPIPVEGIISSGLDAVKG